MGKKPLANQNSHSTYHGDITPTSPSRDDVTIEEADKKLEAMGYTPVSITSHPHRSPQSNWVVLITHPDLEARVLSLVQL